jgi:polyphenol oxidase
VSKVIFEWSKVTDGNMSLKYGDKETVSGNRDRLLNKLGVDGQNIVILSLLGGISIVEASKKDMGKMVVADAVITHEAGVGLLMVVGDCFPVVLYDPVKNVLAMAHCGRAGIEGHLVIKVIERLSDRGSKAGDLMVKIGPGARKESYKFATEDLDQRIDKNDPEWREWLTDDGKVQIMVDLIGFLKKQLKDCGVIEENIEDCGIDTIADKNYFSHYRDRGRQEGRFAVVAMVKN